MTTKSLTLEQKNAARRARVRPYVTYTVILAYTLTTTFATIWLLINDQTDNALALLSGLSAVATGIVGFWFGARGQEKQNESNRELIDETKPLTPKKKNTKEKILAILAFKNLTLTDLASKIQQSDIDSFESLLDKPNSISESDKDKIAEFLKTKKSNLF